MHLLYLFLGVHELVSLNSQPPLGTRIGLYWPFIHLWILVSDFQKHLFVHEKMTLLKASDLHSNVAPPCIHFSFVTSPQPFRHIRDFFKLM